MKYLTNQARLPLLVFGAGTVGAFTRAALYILGKDEGGLLIRNHPLHLLCWVLTIAVALCVGAAVRKAEDSNSFYGNFPRNKGAMVTAAVAAAGILMTVLQSMNQITDKLGLIRVVLGLLTVPALLICGWQRAKGNRPGYYLYGIMCLFYAIHLVCCYRVWSGNPQLADYSLQLFACVFLIVAAYQRMAFCVGLGHRRLHLFCSLMAGYLCILSTAGTEFPVLYLTSGCWFLSDLTMVIRRGQSKAEE